MLDSYIIDEIIKKKKQGNQVPAYVPNLPANDIYRRTPEPSRIEIDNVEEIEDSNCPDVWDNTLVDRLR